ncbi:MAG: protein kinase [Oscillatoriales cyanobacterium C42_A2020_001]|nr:protein kinase [Leptolyngbyaceae cyanobacterium C42_A2020_001]
MDVYCTRPGCPKPVNSFADLDDPATFKGVQQKYCTSCGMPLMLAGRYVPLKLLGQGGFGAAFLARDRYTPGLRQCVVKQFLPSANLSPSQLQTAQDLFEREAQALDELGNAHPQIPDLFAFFELSVPAWQPGKQERFFYLVQEFIDGQTMEQELEQTGVFSSEAVLDVLTKILPVLQFVHNQGAIHRDIKPTNIMRHQNGLIYLLDFGAVRQVTKGGKSTGIYSEGYAPPEQMNGSEVYPSSDLYALAVTSITLLTGKQPNDLYDAYSNSWRWRDQVAEVNPVLADVLDRMLQATPSERFQSCEEVLQALSQVVISRQPVSRKTAFQPANSPFNPTALPNSLASPTPAPAPPAVPRRSAIASFSTLELLAGAGFTGFQGGLLAIALASVLGTTLISAGFWIVLLVGLILAQSRRIIERTDLAILAGLSLALVILIAPLRSAIATPLVGNILLTIVAIAVVGGLTAISITALFRLIYKLLSRFL